MTTCPEGNRPSYKPDRKYGTPQHHVTNPLVRIDGLVQDMPQGFKLPACTIPELDLELDGCEQTLTMHGSTISLSPMFECLSVLSGEGAPTVPPTANNYPIYLDVSFPAAPLLWIWVGDAWLEQTSGTVSGQVGYLNIVDFGAVPDAWLNHEAGDYRENPAKTDNYAAIQACLVAAAMQRKNVYVPAGGAFWYDGVFQPKTLGLGPRRGQRIFGDGAELSMLIGNRTDAFNLIDVFQGSITFEKIGLWGRYRVQDATVPYTTNDTNTCIFRPPSLVPPEHQGNMRIRMKEVQIRGYQTAVNASNGSWLSQFEKLEVIGCRFGLKLKDSYSVLIRGCNFITGTAIYSPNSALLQCEIHDNHFDLGTYDEILDAEVSHKEGEVKVIDVPRELRAYETIDIATQGVDWHSNYFESYGRLHPDHIILNIKSQISDNSTFSHTYINVGSSECILRKISSTVAVSHLQNLSFRNTTLIASNPATKQSWWTYDPSLTYFLYAHDDVKKDAISINNALIPVNQEYLRLYGTLTFDPTIAVQKFNFADMVLPLSNSYIGNTKLISNIGQLNLQAGMYSIEITPQSAQADTVGSKTIDIQINGGAGTSKDRMFDGETSIGRTAKINTYIGPVALGGTVRQVDIVTTGYTTEDPIDLLCLVEIRMVSGQRAHFP